MAYGRRDIRGGAVSTTITGSINSGASSCTIAATTGWPDGGVGGFYVVIDPDTASEEKILCSTRSGSTVNFTTRGADGTSAASHSSGAVIKPIIAAVDIDEANKAVSETVGKVTSAGDMLVGTGANAMQRVAKGSNSTVWQVDSGGTQQYGTVTSAMIADGAIVNGDINASAAIALSKLATQNDQTLLGNISGGAAVPSELTITQIKAMLTNMPWGYVGYGEITGTVALGSSSTEDVTGLTVTWTAVASRKYKVTMMVPGCTNGDALIRESSTTIGRGIADAGNGFWGMVAVIVNNPSAGSHTYKASSARSSSGSWFANATYPSFILVEDIGAST